MTLFVQALFRSGDIYRNQVLAKNEPGVEVYCTVHITPIFFNKHCDGMHEQHHI